MAETTEGIEISPFGDAGFDDCFDAKYGVNQTLLIRQFRFRFHNLDRKQYLARKFEFIKRDFHVSLSHRRSTTASLGTKICIASKIAFVSKAAQKISK